MCAGGASTRPQISMARWSLPQILYVSRPVPSSENKPIAQQQVTCFRRAWDVVGVRRVPARVASATFGRFWGVQGWGGVGGGGMILCFWTSASPKRPSSTLSPSKPEALTPKTPNLESFSIPRIRSQSRHGDAMACAGLIPAALLEVS